MNHGQKPLDDWTKDEMVEAIQDYQEMVGELETLVNNSSRYLVDISPLKVREIINKWVHHEPE